MFERRVVLMVAAALLSGCGVTRNLALVGGSTAAGAYIGAQQGNAAGAAVGALAGATLGEGLKWSINKETEKAYTSGLEKGRSDSVKSLYWIEKNQNQSNEPGEIKYYDLHVPAYLENGVIYEESTITIPIYGE